MHVRVTTAKAYRCCLDFCERWWLASGTLLRYRRKTFETVLGEDVDTALSNSRALREKGVEIWLEILRGWEGH